MDVVETATLDDLFIDVQLKEKSFERYIKARADVEKPGWFKFSNRMLDDDEFYDFTAAETCAWIYVMSQSSLQRSSKVRLILDKVDAFRRKFSRDDLRSVIAKLKDLGILKSHVTSTLRGRNGGGSLGEERIGEERNIAGGEEKIKTPPTEVPILGTVLKDLAGNSKREQVLSRIPIETQQDWVDTYDTKWLKDSLLHAIETHSKNNPIDCVKDWPEKLARWFKIEKKPKFKTTTSPPVKIREPEKPWSNDGHLKALKDPLVAANLRKLKSL